MIKSLLKREVTDLDKAIDKLYDKIDSVEPDSEEYDKYLEKLKKLEDLRDKSRSRRPSSDTVLLVVGNLAGIFIIVAYEHAHVMTSKAIGFIMKQKTGQN